MTGRSGCLVDMETEERAGAMGELKSSRDNVIVNRTGLRVCAKHLRLPRNPYQGLGVLDY